MRVHLPTQRRSIALGAGAVILVVGLALAFSGVLVPAPTPTASPDLASASPSPSPSASPSPSPSPSPTPTDLTAADLDGVLTDPIRAHRLPIAVLVDDNRVARPQSGFNAASIVYQAPADGGETRYMLVFQEGDGPDIGPIRSGRIYFVHWASEYAAAIAHYGGDKVTLRYIAAHAGAQFTNVDALAGSNSAFHRISTRDAPHNAYASTDSLRALIEARHGPLAYPPGGPHWTFVDDTSTASLPAAAAIRIPYGTGLVTYAFDPAIDAYRRSVDGAPQVDPADGQPVVARNVVVLFMSFRIDRTIEPGHARPVIGDVGSGRAIVYVEGRLIEATWSKADEVSPTRLVDASGAEIHFVRGTTYVQVVPLGTAVTPD